MATINKIGYKLVKNNTDTAEKAPYTGMAIPVGSLAYDNILTAMVDSGTHMTKATAQYFLNAFFEYCADVIASDVVRVSTGTVSVFPAISGSFASEDAEFDPTKNALYVGAALSQEVRDAVGAIEPVYAGESDSTGGVKISSVMDIETETFKVIRGTNNFRLAGVNLTVPDASDESLALYSKDLLTKICDITTSETDGGQRITCHLPATVAIAKGAYKIRIASHGIDPTDPLTISSISVTVTEAVAPTPALTKVKQGSRADNLVGFGTGSANAFVVTGVIPGGFKETDGLKLDGAPTTATGSDFQASMSLASYVTASTDTSITIGDGIENDSEKPDEDWQDKACRIVLTRDGVEYPLTASFKNP